eukprot:2661217-Rhodomonas_salina.1
MSPSKNESGCSGTFRSAAAGSQARATTTGTRRRKKPRARRSCDSQRRHYDGAQSHWTAGSLVRGRSASH